MQIVTSKLALCGLWAETGNTSGWKRYDDEDDVQECPRCVKSRGFTNHCFDTLDHYAWIWATCDEFGYKHLVKLYWE